MRQATDQPTTRRRASVREAAEVLGISVEAVRGRIKRGTIPHGKADNGGVYVWLEIDHTGDQSQPDDAQDADQGGDRTSENPALMKELHSEVAFLREEIRRRDERHTEEIRRRDHLLAAALERIPAIDPPQHSHNGHQDDGEGTVRVEDPTDNVGSYGPPGEPQDDHHGDERRPWWKRIFD